MSRSTIGFGAAIAAVVVLLCCGIVGLPMMFFAQQSAQAGECGGTLPSLGGSAPPGSVAKWDGNQRANAAVIVATGGRMGIPARGFVIALAVAMQESTLHVLANDNPQYPLVAAHSLALPHQGVGRDHDSVGLFQQRPSPPEGAGGWGTVGELMDPATSAAKFYASLQRIPDWQKLPLTVAAQMVQRSAFPDAYQKWQADAQALAAYALGLPNIDAIGGGDPTAPCGPDALGGVLVGPGGWVQPVRAPIVSPFGPRDGSFHAGVDLGAPRGSAIRAASAGVVEVAQCQSGIGTCDRDGGPDVAGCGWYVDIRHAGNVVTRYCHMLRQPEVKPGDRVQAGQVIGFVGASGHVTGPHLHFEVHLNVPSGAGQAGQNNAVDPVPFMRQVGAPLAS
jgi:murein DD-endopeptidase MepM/ murein hydrolase activator NlpD